jgi:hypothetical protein
MEPVQCVVDTGEALQAPAAGRPIAHEFEVEQAMARGTFAACIVHRDRTDAQQLRSNAPLLALPAQAHRCLLPGNPGNSRAGRDLHTRPGATA